MKKIFTLALLFPLISACSINNKEYEKAYLKEASNEIVYDYEATLTNEYKSLIKSVKTFSSDLNEAYYSLYNQIDKNYVFSPISLYFAMAMVGECANGNTKNEIYDALDIDGAVLNNYIKHLYARCQNGDQSKSPKNQNMFELLTNSAWFCTGHTFNPDCIDSLANDYYTSTFEDDFVNNNAEANKKMEQYVSDKTFKLLEPKFTLDLRTLLVLLNTYYLKTAWFEDGEKLNKEGNHTFKNSDGTTTNSLDLLIKNGRGEIYKDTKFTSPFVTTESDIKIRFIVPNDGYSLNDIMDDDTLDKINSLSFAASSYEKKLDYYSTVYFPCFEASSEFDAIDLLKEIGIHDLFDKAKCDLRNVTQEEVVVSGVNHGAKLIVNEQGIEGAAYTRVEIKATSTEPFEEIHDSFIVDKAFAYVVYNRADVPVFSGIINEVK